MFVCSKPKARCWRSIINRLIRSSSFDVRKMIFEFVTMFDKMVFNPSLKAGVGNDWLLLVIHMVILRILSHFLKNFEGKSFCKKPW